MSEHMSELNYRPEIKKALDNLLIGIPMVTAGKAFGYLAYKVSGKVFAWVAGRGFSFKLPLARCRALIKGNPKLRPMEIATGIVWREWLSVEDVTAEECAEYLPFLEESIRFVNGEAPA